MYFVDVNQVKEKFARFVSILFLDGGIPLANINDKIINNDLFDFMENNDTNSFLETSNEELFEKLYSGKLYIDYSNGVVSEVYWSALEMINISINFEVPLKQVALLFPLNEIINYFPVYHEMNDIEICKVFLNEKYKKSILKELISGKYSRAELELLTGIPACTLRKLENNESLFNTSFSNIAILSSVLNSNVNIFKKTSNFIPYDKCLLDDKDFIYDLFDGIVKISPTNIKDSGYIYVRDLNLIDKHSSLIFSEQFVPNIKDIKQYLATRNCVYYLSLGCMMYKMSGGKVNSYNLEDKYLSFVKIIISKLLKKERTCLYF